MAFDAVGGVSPGSTQYPARCSNGSQYIGDGGGAPPPPLSLVLGAKLDSMNRCLKQLIGAVQSLSAAMSTSAPAAGDAGANGEFMGGYKECFSDGYSHGFHEVHTKPKPLSG